MDGEKLFCPQSFLTHQKAKLQAPQNPWKHDNFDANKLGQKTDFPGPIIAENLLKNSWLGPAENDEARIAMQSQGQCVTSV